MSSALRTAPREGELPAIAGRRIEPLEAALLGALIREPHLLDRVGGLVAAEHFSEPIGERIFMALESCSRRSEVVTPARVADALGAYEWDRAEGADLFIDGLLATDLAGLSLEEVAAEIRAAGEQRAIGSQAYFKDVAGWAFREVARLRDLSRRPDLGDALDWDNLIEEIRCAGRSEVGAVARRIELVLVHAVKAISTPDPRLVRGWRSEIELHLRVMQQTYAPSMRQLVNMDRLWRSAAREARRDLDEHGERLSRQLPDRSPFTLDELLDASDADAIVAFLTGRLDTD